MAATFTPGSAGGDLGGLLGIPGRDEVDTW